MADLETLSIRIEADANKAYKAIDKLANSLGHLSISLAAVEVGKLAELSNGLVNLNTAILQVKNTSKASDYTRMARELNSLGTVNANGINELAASLGTLMASLQNVTNVSQFSDSIKLLSNTIGTLGGAKVEKAIVAIPKLEKALAHLIQRFSKLPEINQNIIDFVNSLSNLASQGQHVGTATKGVANSLDKFTVSATKATKHSKSLASTIGLLYAKFWLFLRGARALKSSFESAADYLEAFNYFDVTARKIGKDTFAKAGVGSAEDYAEAFTATLREKLKKMSGLELDLEDRLIKTTNAKSLGLNLTELTQYQASIASITNAMGVSQEVAESTAKTFSMLAGDMSSLRNMDFSQVAQKLQSGLAGQARALYQFGIDITNATLQQYAYAAGVDKAVSEMTQAEKAQLRLLAILDQSKVAWGDLANTINSPSNQLRMLKTNLKEVGTVFGQLFIPVMQSALPVINGLALAIKQLLVDIAELLGIKLDLDSFGTFGDEIAEDVEAVEDLNSAMKETKKGIREFDELKVINNSKDKGTGLGEEIDLTKQILEATAEYEKVWDEAYDRMKSKAQEIAQNISSALKPIKDIFEDFHVGDFFKAGEDVSNLVISIFDFFTKAINRVDWESIGNKIGDFFKGIKWKEILKSVANFVWSAIQSAFKLWRGSFDVAPIETAIITAFALLKFTGLGAVLTNGIKESLKKTLTQKGFTKELAAGLGLGAVTLGIGVAISIDNITKIKNGERTLRSAAGIIETLVASAVEGAGIAIIAGTLGIASGGIAFGIGAAIALAINLLIADSVEMPSLEQAELIAAKEYEWVDEHHLDTLNVITDLHIKKGNVELEFSTIEELAEKVYDLSVSYNDLTDGEKGLLKYYSDQLIEVMPQLAEKIDAVSGAYKGTREELDKLLEKQKEQMLLNAYSGNMEEVLNQKSVIQKDIHQLEKDKEDAEKALQEEKKKYTALLYNPDTKTTSDFSDQLVKDIREKSSRLSQTGEGKNTKYWYEMYDAEAGKKVKKDVTDLVNAMAKINVIDTKLGVLREDLDTVTEDYVYWEDEYKKQIEKTAKDTRDGFNGVATEAGKGVDKINDALSEGVDGSLLSKSLQNAFDDVNTTINNEGTISKTEMNDLFDKINTSFNGLGDGKVPEEVQKTMDNIKWAIQTNSPSLISYMSALRQQMEDAFVNAKYDKKGELVWNPFQISERLGTDFGKIEMSLNKAGKADTSAFKTLKADITELFGGTLPEEVDKAYTNVADTINNGKGATAIKESLTKLKRELTYAASDLGMNLDLSLGSSIDKYGNVVYNATYDLGGKAENGFKDKEEINSPSKVFRRLGKFIPDGTVLGIEDGIPDVEKAITTMTQAIQQTYSGVKYNIPKINLGNYRSANSFNYGNMDSNNGFMSQMVNMMNASQDKGQTEVVFRVEGDPYGLFKVVREQNNSYYKRTGRSAF